nr:MAG TPA: hypothetical protein [Caudoviricetes sp.]
MRRSWGGYNATSQKASPTPTATAAIPMSSSSPLSVL